MATGFEHAAIPEAFGILAGTPDEGTRIFRMEGDHGAMRRWFNALCEHIGPAVSPGGAAVYAGVSRAGVYKRMKAGGLTAFCFHITGDKKTWLGGNKKLKQWALVYIPVSECKAWRSELEERLARMEAQRATAEDQAALEEADPREDDPSHAFLDYDPKDRKRRGVRYVDTVPDTSEDDDGD